MNIKNIILAITLVVTGVCVVIGIFAYIFLTTYQYSLRKADVAQDIARAVFERRLLADEYVANRSERARSQWFVKQNALKQMVARERDIFTSPQEVTLLARIDDAVISSEEVFNSLLASEENGASSADATPSELAARLSSQLSVRAQEAISAATTLADMHTANLASNLTKIIVIFAVALLLLLAVLGASFRIIWKSASELYTRKMKDEAILQGIGDGVVAIDRAWNIVLFNKAASLISGWSEREALGKPLRSILKFVSEKDREEHIDFIERTMVSGTVNEMQNHTLLITRDGREIPAGDSAAPIVDEQSQITGAVIIFRDMTREQEAAMLKSDFAYATHQFRTPLTKCIWGLETAIKKTTDAATRTILHGSLRSVQSVNKLSEQLLEISEIDQGHVWPKLHGTDVAMLLKEAHDGVKEIALAKKINIASAETAGESVKTDSKLVRRVLYEILHNAVLYSPNNSTITVDAEITNTELSLKIQDAGIGMPEEEQPLIFHKFFRGSNFDTTELVGAGLGLYIAKSYVTLLKGRIWFKSTENKGTTFFIVLPIAK